MPQTNPEPVLSVMSTGDSLLADEQTRIRTHAFETFGSASKALHWLARPNSILGGKTPYEVLLLEPGAVEDELVRIDHGIYV